MTVKEEREKVGLKLNIQKTKIMASGPITSWQMDRETVETVADFTFLGSKKNHIEHGQPLVHSPGKDSCASPGALGAELVPRSVLSGHVVDLLFNSSLNTYVLASMLPCGKAGPLLLRSAQITVPKANSSVF